MIARGNKGQKVFRQDQGEKDSYLLELSAYIHLNPVRANLVKDPSEYPWTSYREYSKGGGAGLVGGSFVLSQFSKVKGRAIRDYVRFVRGQVAVGHGADLYRVRDQRFLGPDSFVERVGRERSDELSYICDISIQELVVQVSSAFGMPMETVCSMTRNREGAWGRGIVGYFGKKLCDYSVKSLAEYFHRDPVAMSRGMGKVERRMGADKDLKTKLRKLEEAIILDRKRKIRN